MFNEDLYSKELIFNTETMKEKFSGNIVIDDWKYIELLNGEAKFLSPVKVQLLIKRNSSNFIVKGSVETSLELECSRCLNMTESKIKSDFEAVYIDESVIKTEKTEHLKSLENYIEFDGINLDLTERIIEAIILSVPEKILCREDCKGLCQICGTNLNENPDHKCEEDYIDPRFETLKKLLENNNSK
ncbi:MAG: DUF177 domain-containing protein [Thermotogae bacterium]|nr:DUF177 domain-containing protein [Thermotogota bacterium]MCP5465450.1 DUF177 domain-containing protein [Thermotogota bacterium]HOO75043.1 DUF177 domain-containing protein [Tepiditoga sp.]